jgi:hypothetical protein
LLQVDSDDRTKMMWGDVDLFPTLFIKTPSRSPSGTLGQKYDGTSAGSGGANFFFHNDKNRIFVGSLKDLSVFGQLIP